MPDIGHPFVRVTVTPVSRFIRRTLHGQMCFLVGSNPIRMGREGCSQSQLASDSCSSDVKERRGKRGGATAKCVFLLLAARSAIFVPLYRTIGGGARGVPFVAIPPISGDGRGREMRSPALSEEGGRQMIDWTVKVRRWRHRQRRTTRHDVTTRVADGRTVYELPR